jgi:AraC family transcriptional regulator, regulatory protein of adaptative response / methylated-DNA-[protein]-cysteine methyltransferase
MPPTKSTRRASAKPHFSSDDARWQAVVQKDRSADGAFYFSVRTTGVFCRPSCPARLPNRGNVQFHATLADAARAGFRPCKRCRPDEISLGQRQLQAIAKTCRLIETSDVAPSLQQLARSACLSPSHLHRLFKAHTGLTPKAYATALRQNRLRHSLRNGKTVTAAIYEAGFNSSSRFYAASSKALGMTPKTFRSGGSGITIRFTIGQCSLGSILVAASEVGICAISLGDDPRQLLHELENNFPKANLVAGDKRFEKWLATAIAFIERPAQGLDLPLDLQGTALQRRVWQALSKVPCGQTTSYTQIARRVGRPDAVRAVAQAIAANKIAVAVPCHRVLRADGSLCGFRWGVQRKAALLERERDQFASKRPLH